MILDDPARIVLALMTSPNTRKITQLKRFAAFQAVKATFISVNVEVV